MSSFFFLRYLDPDPVMTVNLACFHPTGAHILSGNCYETRALSELFPDWKEQGVSYSDILISIITFLEHSVHKL